MSLLGGYILKTWLLRGRTKRVRICVAEKVVVRRRVGTCRRSFIFFILVEEGKGF